METRSKNQLNQQALSQWLNKHDGAKNLWVYRHQDLSVLYNGNLSLQARVLYLHLKTLGKGIFSTNEDLAHCLKLTETEVHNFLSELECKGLIIIHGKGQDRVITVGMCYPLCNPEEIENYLNITSDKFRELIEKQLLYAPHPYTTTLDLLHVKRYDIVQRERARKNLHKFFKAKLLLHE